MRVTGRPSIGVIGLGNMGGRMAKHLSTKGFVVYGYDVDSGRIAGLSEGGIKESELENMSDHTDTVILSLPTVSSISAVLKGYRPKKGDIIIDMSTVPPSFSRENHAKLAKNGVSYLDAPVIGMPGGIGDWTVPVGGDREAFERARAVLEALASKLYMVGASGNGAAIKVINNMISLTTWAVISEAVLLADKLGIDLTQLYQIISGSGGGAVSPMLKRVERILARDYANICSVDVNIKDLAAAVELGQSASVPLLVTSSALHLHMIASEKGLGNLDMDAIPLAFESFRKRHGRETIAQRK